MAINRIAAPGSTPSALADWSAVVAQLAALGLNREAPVRVVGTNVVKGAFFNVGGVMYLADADTAITGTASGYVKITPAGATASAAFVANLSGVTWNSTYNGYYDASGNLYVFDDMKAYLAGVIPNVNDEYLGIEYYLSRAYVPDASRIIASADVNVVFSNTSYAKKKEIKIDRGGTIKYSFSLDNNSYGRVYINGSAVGSEHYNVTGNTVVYTGEIAVSRGDLVQLYLKANVGIGRNAKEFRLYGHESTITVTMD